MIINNILSCFFICAMNNGLRIIFNKYIVVKLDHLFALDD